MRVDRTINPHNTPDTTIVYNYANITVRRVNVPQCSTWNIHVKTGKQTLMTKITRLSQLDLNSTYSYADYLTWRLNQTVELIKGKIMLMSPAPNLKHQSISGQLHGLCFNYFRHKTCRLFAAPFDVRLIDLTKSAKANTDIYTVVQPDLCVICDPKKLNIVKYTFK